MLEPELAFMGISFVVIVIGYVMVCGWDTFVSAWQRDKLEKKLRDMED